ncbi:MAG: PAS domain-containing methyl-accepting chemotaxis protein [Planctomycetota bacterium]
MFSFLRSKSSRTATPGHAPVVGENPGQVLAANSAAVQQENAQAARDTEARAELDAIGRSQALIRFATDGTIRDANPTFLKVMGYRAEDIEGQHHRMFVDPAYAASPEYAEFWRMLASGRFVSGVFRRVARGGRTVWLQASYNPVFDDNDKVVGVIKVAADITARKQREADALNRTTAAIEFRPDGTIVDANETFLKTMGYTREEIRGQHHSMFVDGSHVRSAEYTQFWRDLAQGTYQQGQFSRLKKGGQQIWLRGSYSPVLDDDGHVVGVVKHATDVTAEVRMKEEAARVSLQLGSGLTELSASASAISGRVVRNAEIATETRTRSAAAAELLQKLDQTTKSIGVITGMIRDVADRTNLLALNASVEAARAGEAGRGFAVVAGEVKELAKQSRSATGEISAQLAEISNQVAASVAAVAAICRDIESVADNTSEVAAAVEQQSSVVQELSMTAETLAAHSGVVQRG